LSRGRTAEPPGELNLGLLCFIVYRAMESRVLDALAAAGFDDVTAAQGRVFARIAPGGTRVGELAEQARISKQTAGFLVDQLERAGYVQRVPDPSDARARLVRIAGRGRAAVDVARRVEAEVEAEWTHHLGAAAAAQLRAALTALREITDPYG
jgi:DNA-binding MarR family transcriptional regulator